MTSRWVKKQRMMRRYDLTAEIYHMRYSEEQKTKIEAALEKVKTESFGLVLDAGCGTGILFDYVADRAKVVVAVDISRKTLLQARKRVQSKRLANVHLVQADVDNMPFRNGICNHVFAITVVQNTPNPAETLSETRRVAKNDAVYVITGLKKIFSQKRFEAILRKARLRSAMIEKDELKCHVAVCTNRSR